MFTETFTVQPSPTGAASSRLPSDVPSGSIQTRKLRGFTLTRWPISIPSVLKASRGISASINSPVPTRSSSRRTNGPARVSGERP